MLNLSSSLANYSKKARSKAAIVAELLPQIEGALKDGYSHEAIFESIKKTEGIELTFGYYKNTIHRMRQRQEPAPITPTANPTSIAQTPLGTKLTSATTQSTDAPTSRLQAALADSIADFFS